MPFFTVVSNFMAQSGDIINGNGTGGESIYGKSFDDENFLILHNRDGIVGMANNGPNTNSSQFYITTVPCPHLDGINVAFGIVRKGLNIVIEMSDIKRIDDVPVEPIKIINCGEIKAGENWNYEENDETSDIYPSWPNDWEIDTNNKDKIKDAISKIKDSGNYYYKKNNLIDAERKYKKVLRYIDWYISVNKDNSLQDVRNKSLLNLAVVRLKNEKPKDVVDLCSQVILKDPTNGKAYFRRAQARLSMKEYDKALNDLNRAITLHPNDKTVRSLLMYTKKQKLLYLNQEKNIFTKMFKY